MQHAILHTGQDPGKISLAIDRQARTQLRFLPGKAFEIGLLLERPIKPRRGNFQPVVVDVLDREQPRQLVADRSAILYRDAIGAVNENSQQACARTGLDIHKFVAQSRYRLLD